ncbi:MAG: hypothetical protein H6719_14850 [Sandaracinaceae bacterium]|nr:hypothetical protein [Sandaracinaceae bacterium]
MRLRSELTALSLLLASCGGATPAPTATATAAAPPRPRHAILVDRPEHAGQRWRVRATGRETEANEIIIGDGDHGSREVEARVIEMSAVVTILEVDAEGRQLRLRYDIESLTLMADEQRADLVPAGGAITIIRGEEPVIDLDGQPLDPALQDQLDLVMELGVDQSDDDVFGSSVPRAVGDEWTLDGERARRALAETGIAVGQVTGRMRVQDEVDVDGEPCLDLRGHMTLTGLELPPLPEGARAESAGMHMLFEGLYPLDLTHHERSERSKLTTTVDVRMGPTRLRSVQTREVRRTFEPLPDAS